MKMILFIHVMIAAFTVSACASSAGMSTNQPSVTHTAVLTAPTATSPSPVPPSTFTAVPPTATPGTIASSSANCSGLRSMGGDDLTSITFVNWSGRTVNVYWVNFQGLEEFRFDLQPDQSRKQATYVTRIWCVRDKASNEALLAVVGAQHERVATVLRDIQWQETIPIPNASSAPFNSLRGQQLIFHNDRVYIFGGRSESDERLTSVYFSAIQSNGTLAGWQETTPLPGKYYDHVTVKLGDYVYLLTGADGADDVYYASFNADGSLGAWKETAPFSPSRQTFAAASHGNFIYATGGNAGGTKNFVQYTSVNADGSLNPWAQTRSLPLPIQEHTMIAFNGYLYVFGGKNILDEWTNTVYFSAINPDGRLADWNTTTPLPRALQGSAVFEVDGYVYLLSGNSAYYSRVLENHSLGNWPRTTSLPAVHNGLRVGANNDYAYAIGGSDSAGYQSTVFHAWLGLVAEHPDCTSGWTRLRVDSYAKVAEVDPSPNRVRDAPHTSAKMISQIYPGGIVRVLEGPVCANGFVFWKVESQSIPGGGIGWTAEGDGQKYYLEPIQ
jgi:hypothetical protein